MNSRALCPILALLVAGGLASAEVRASEVPFTVQGPPQPGAQEVTDFMDLMISGKPHDSIAKLMSIGAKSFDKVQVLIDPLTGVALYQSTDLLNWVMDVMAISGPDLFEVESVGKTWWGDEIRAIHVRVPVESPARPDDAERPTLLVECNMHGREWLAMESCARFLERLFAAYVYYPLETLAFMQHVNLYVIPVANPDGRNLDDGSLFEESTDAFSNPIDYFSSNYWHADGARGWRPNLQVVDCVAHPDFDTNFGIDLARNFSRGWAFGSSDCMSQSYRGEYPFQAPEAAALRRFVNNRTISMSLHVHSFVSSMRGRLEGSYEVESMRDGFIQWWNDTLGLLSAADYEVVELTTNGPTGGGYGQFSAWMSSPSNWDPDPNIEELDLGTHRAVNAFMLELPPCGNYGGFICPKQYYGSEYDIWLDSESNAFRPTAPAIIEDVVPAFIAALSFFVKQAQYPWCAIDPDPPFDPGSCSDVGLTGSKIAAGTHEIGVLDWVDTGTEAYETALPGSYGAVYRIQNFDTTIPATVDVEVEVASKPFISSTYAVDDTFTTTHSLAAGGSGVGEAADSLFAYTSGLDYRVTITIASSSLAGNEPRNDRHMFRFRVP